MKSLRPHWPVRSGVRLVLIVGFSGLLCLLGFSGLYAIHSLRQVASLDEQSTRDFVRRSDALAAVRSNAYLAHSQVRDFLLDREPGASEGHRDSASAVWKQAMTGLEAYRLICPPEQKPAFEALQESLAQYWRTASPALEWSYAQRMNEGYDLLAQQLSTRRDEFLRLLDGLRRDNEVDLRSASAQSAELIHGLQNRLTGVVALALLIGAALAVLTAMQLLRLEHAAQLRYEASIEDRAQLESLSARLLEIQEEERRRISRELHDEVGQSLSGLLVDVANASAELPGDCGPIRRHLDSIKRAAESTLSSIRNLSLLLRPSMLDDLGLIPALRWQARETARRTGMAVEVAAEDWDLELPDEYRTTIYRVVQESLNNAARHSGAKTVVVVVRSEPQRLLVVVQDDGKGFTGRNTKGMGLLGMRERVTHLGGRLTIESELGKGVDLRVELPPVIDKSTEAEVPV
jgi:signal transduction histidine kinase